VATIAVDGSKIKAKASRRKAMSYGRMQSTQLELKAQINALIKKATNADETDLDNPAEIELRQDRLAAIEAAKVRLEERQH
jgi:predicted nuclease with TOPRIM domain